MKDFEPVVQPEMNVRIFDSTKTYGYFEVTHVEPVGYIIKDFAVTISSESWSRGNEFQEVYVQDSEMAQWRMKVLDDIEVRLAQLGKELKRGSLKYGVPVNVSLMTELIDETLKSTEFYTYRDEKVYVDIYNPTQSSISRNRVVVFGYKFKLNKLDSKPGKYTNIPIGVIQ
jgi:hypothetical protein